MKKGKPNQTERGITLIALIITILILIILSFVTVKIATDNGLISVTDKSISIYIEKDKQERLEHVLEAAKIEKERNKNFNKNIDLDKIIKNDIPETEINGDKITITGTDFFIDRDKLSIRYEEPKGELAEGDIPIYSAVQIQKIGTGETMYIDGKKYVFDKNKKYVLQNDIEYVGSYKNIAELIKNGEVIFDGKSHKVIVTDSYGVKEYYTEENKYYMGTNKYGYVSDGLELYYDGIDNIGTGIHSNSSTVWRDLSGNNKDGTLTGGTWENNYLKLNGSSDGVSVGNQLETLFNGDNTVEMLIYLNSYTDHTKLMSNYNLNPFFVWNVRTGGYIYMESSGRSFNSTDSFVTLNSPIRVAYVYKDSSQISIIRR